MRKRSVVGLVVIIVLVCLLGMFVINGVSVGVYDIVPLKGIKQGLDITGGVSIVYQAQDTSIEDFDTKMDGAMLILRNRLDSRGYTEATISKQGDDKIRVEISINETSEITDPTEVSSFIGTPAHLEFVDPNGEVIMEGKDIESAKLALNAGEPVVSFSLTDEGATAFAAATTEFVGQTISIELDGAVISAPKVNSAITGGQGIIEGEFTEESAQNLAMQIESGALPIDLNEIEVRSISATLGVDALDSSIMAGLIGLAILFIFLLVYYRLPGLVACISLTIYVFFVLLLLGSVPGVQLTLPGIAGIVLGIGMAVDANVIIFERFKEEYKTGKTLRTSFKAGTQKAFITILDSNVTTLICAIVLAVFGTGQIKSFAYTLIISIITSMICAVLIANGIMKLFINMNIKNPNVFMWHAKEVREKAIAAREGGAAQ
ncbi:MAG: protein translocase subunit SecD [Christensenellaceae bacterium]|jgi:preprotein translocase subunit SecD